MPSAADGRASRVSSWWKLREVGVGRARPIDHRVTYSAPAACPLERTKRVVAGRGRRGTGTSAGRGRQVPADVPDAALVVHPQQPELCCARNIEEISYGRGGCHRIDRDQQARCGRHLAHGDSLADSGPRIPSNELLSTRSFARAEPSYVRHRRRVNIGGSPTALPRALRTAGAGSFDAALRALPLPGSPSSSTLAMDQPAPQPLRALSAATSWMMSTIPPHS